MCLHICRWRKATSITFPLLWTLSHVSWILLEPPTVVDIYVGGLCWWPGIFYQVNDVSVYPGRYWGEGFPIERTSLRPYLVVSSLSTGVSNVCSRLEIKTACVKCGVDTEIIHVIKYTRLSPSIFAYCKWSKTGQWEGLETRLFINSYVT